MEHRRQATAEEIEWLGPGTRGDVCRVPGGDRAAIDRTSKDVAAEDAPVAP